MTVAQRRFRARCGYLLFVLGILMTLVGCGGPPPDLVTQPMDPGAAMRGKQLAEGLAACGLCHGQEPLPSSPLAGGRVWHDKYGPVTAPNITSSKSGVGEWTTNQLMQAIRGGVGRDGDLLSREVHEGYQWMSDEDVLSIVAYLRSVLPIEHEVERRSVGIIDRNTTGFFDRTQEVRGYVPSINPRFETEYGYYLVDHVARCQACHNTPDTFFTEGSYLGGGRSVRSDLGELVAPGIGGSDGDPIEGWSEEQVVRFLSTGQSPEGREVDSRFCPVGFFRNASPSDLRAIAHFLKVVPALR